MQQERQDKEKGVDNSDRARLQQFDQKLQQGEI